jgi:positive regulator of sigma E activity
VKQSAVVVMRNGKLMAEVARSEACQQCRACRFGRREKVYVELTRGAYREGEVIELELDGASLSKASLIAYGIPIAAFFAGLFIARAFTDVDYIQAIAAIGAMGIALLVIKGMEGRIRASGKFAPKARKCREIGGEYGGDIDT